MKPNNSITRGGGSNTVMQIKGMTTDPKMVARFQEVIGKKAPQFLASIVSAVSGNRELQNADPKSVMAAAMIAATLNLDINPSLGFAAIIPYKKNTKLPDGSWETIRQAQFQIMSKGFIQLALRSGQYKNINVTEIYQDEFIREDVITGDVHLNPLESEDRLIGNPTKIVGYVAYMEFINGFRKMIYWSVKKITNHAKKFSKSWDERGNTFYKGSAWDSNFEAMCKKTVIKNALSSWGILSTQMQNAVVADGGAKKDIDALLEYPEEQEMIGEVPEENLGKVHEEVPKKAPKKPPKETQKEAPKKLSGSGFDDSELDSFWG